MGGRQKECIYVCRLGASSSRNAHNNGGGGATGVVDV